jgi:hypothetical protein
MWNGKQNHSVHYIQGFSYGWDGVRTVVHIYICVYETLSFVGTRVFYECAILMFFYYLVCEAIGTAATPGLLCQPRVLVKMIVEKQMECKLAGETEILGEYLPQRHFCPRC